MRPRDRSASPHGPILWALVAVVLLAHAASLLGLHRLAMNLGSVQAMDEPLFTRMLAPATPPSLPAAPVLPPVPVLEPKQSTPMDSIASNATKTEAIEPKVEKAPEPEPVKPEPPKPGPVKPEEPPKLTQADTIANSAMRALDTLGLRDTATAVVAAPVVASISTSVSGSATGTVEAWPSDTRLNYRVTGDYRGPINGKASVTWQRTGDKYQVLLNLNLGIIDVKMISQGLVKPATLWPQVYEEMLSRPRKLRLDEQALAFSDGNTMARPVGVQDTVSQFVELTQRFATGRAKLEQGAVVHVPLARPGGFNDWYYDVSLEPALPTRLNQSYREIAAWHLKPRPVVNARGPITMEFWIVPELQYFPARVRITLDKEAYLELDVETIQQR